ncbi:MAG TPA: hypothetical protein VIM07_10790 [Chitinophagaceae bacterium]
MPGTYKNNQPHNFSKDKQDSRNNGENRDDALRQAENDIKNDPDLDPKSDAAADLDEGELAIFDGD